MFRISTSPRFFVGLALTAVAGAGIGLGVAELGTSSAPVAPAVVHTLTAAAATVSPPATGATSAPAPLTIDQVKAIALHVSPGTVVELKQETPDPTEAADPTEATDPTEAADPTEPADPTEAADTAEPAGLTYEVTVQHPDGSETKVVVDGTTGRVLSTKVEDAGN